MKPFEVSQKIEVFLSDEQQRQICLDYLYNKFQWRDNYHIKDNNVITNKVYHSSHSWNSEQIVREASEIDRAIESIVKQIKFK